MLEIFELYDSSNVATMKVVLSYEERKKSRHRCRTACGKDIGWFLPRGNVLQQGDILKCSSGELVAVVAAAEQLSEAVSSDQLLISRAAYHLGNRHVPVQIEPGHLRYQSDHVLDDMLSSLGLKVDRKQMAFHPEFGAYHGGGDHGH